MARSVIEGGLSKAAAARQFNTTPNTIAKWVDRFRADGVGGLQDRSSRPRSSQAKLRTCQPNLIDDLEVGRLVNFDH